jgi:hypothetical protein
MYLSNISKEVKCNKQYGTAIANITKYLKNHNIKYSYKRHVLMKQIVKALMKGKGVIYLYKTPQKYGHYIFFANGMIIFQPIYQLLLYAINETSLADGIPKKSIAQWVSAKYYTKHASRAAILRKQLGCSYPHAWFIRKK